MSTCRGLGQLHPGTDSSKIALEKLYWATSSVDQTGSAATTAAIAVPSLPRGLRQCGFAAMPNAELSEFKRLCELVDHNEIKKTELNQLYAEQKILFSPSTLTNFVYAKAGKPARSYLSMKKPPKITPSKRQRSKSPAPKAEQQDAHELDEGARRTFGLEVSKGWKSCNQRAPALTLVSR